MMPVERIEKFGTSSGHGAGSTAVYAWLLVVSSQFSMSLEKKLCIMIRYERHQRQTTEEERIFTQPRSVRREVPQQVRRPTEVGDAFQPRSCCRFTRLKGIMLDSRNGQTG